MSQLEFRKILIGSRNCCALVPDKLKKKEFLNKNKYCTMCGQIMTTWKYINLDKKSFSYLQHGDVFVLINSYYLPNIWIKGKDKKMYLRIITSPIETTETMKNYQCFVLNSLQHRILLLKVNEVFFQYSDGGRRKGLPMAPLSPRDVTSCHVELFTFSRQCSQHC